MPVLESRWRAERKKPLEAEQKQESRSAIAEQMRARTRLVSLRTLIDNHVSNSSSPHFDEDSSVESRKELTAMRAEAEQLTRELAGKGVAA